MRKGVLALFSVVVVACSSSAAKDDELGQATEQPIIGGVLDHGDPAVGYMSAQSGNTGWGCSGAMISPTVFATAAHCVDDRTASTVFKVTFVHDQSKATASEWHAVKEAHHDSRFLQTGYINDGHDCAVLILKDPVNVAPIPLNREAVDGSWHGQSIRLVGYGNNNGRAGTGSGIKREVTVPIANHRDGVVEINTAGRTTCQGDSGGPGLVKRNGVEVLASITSYGAQYCPGEAGLSRADLCADFFDRFLGGTCTPNCSGRQCGSDGCGGSCGTCGNGQTCSSSGQCTGGGCTPSCNGKQCGDDGCGGSCGTCGNGQICDAGGQCVGGSCTPEAEPNDTSSTGNALGPKLCGALTYSDYVDWSQWSVAGAGVAYKVKLVASGDAQLLMWKYVGGQWYTIDLTGHNEIARTANGAGTYAVAVYSPSRSSQSYTLTLDR
jgi:V8-like Glu-specific endopeptidase